MQQCPGKARYTDAIYSAACSTSTGELRERINAPHGLRLLQDLRRQLLQPPAAKEVIGQAVTAAA
jgi:hypothetical protein